MVLVGRALGWAGGVGDHRLFVRAAAFRVSCKTLTHTPPPPVASNEIGGCREKQELGSMRA